jgi:hypothetical protein
MTTAYTPSQPGTWLLLVNGDAVLYVEAAAATEVGELWAAVSGEAPVQATLEILTRSGLGSAPSFALAHVVGGTLHALVRGPLVLDAVAAGGTEAIDGTGVSTWRETTVDGVTALSLGEHAGHLPIGSGVVWASGFAFQPGGTPIAAAVIAPLAEPVVAVAAPVPAAEPVAAPAPVAAPVIEVPVAAPIAAAVTPAPAAPPAEVTDPDLPSEHTMVEREEEPEPEPAPVIAPMPSSAPAIDNSYSHLFEETVHRSIEEAAIREAEPEEAAAAAAPAVAASLGDHDGETVMSGDISELRGRKKAAAEPAVIAPASSIYLELPNNQREALGQPVIIGRSPSVSQVSGAELPRLVSIPGSQDISRNHARFAVEGGTVVVTDLHSRNGTSVALPGKPPQMLRKGEPTAVLPGTVVDLGGGISLTVREG